MLPTTFTSTTTSSKDNKKTFRQHSFEDGYHSLPGSPWTPIATAPTHHFGNNTMPSSGAEFLPPLNSSFINRDTTTTLDGRGILIERIKVAQHTIDSLSAKVFFFENERTLLKEKKEQFEAGYYKLVEENSKLLNEKIYKDTLLKKLNLMEEEIGKLLKTQENLQEKYNEQLHSIDRYKRDNTNLKDEVEALKKVNQEIHLAATKDTASLERIRNSEEEMKNQSIVLRIEKETLGSEVDRLIGKLKNQDEKLRCRKEKEQDLIKDNSILRQEIRIKDRELRDVTENGVYLQDQLKMVMDEKNDFANQSKHESFLVHEEIRELQGKLDASQKCLSEEKIQTEKLRQTNNSLKMEVEKLKSKLLNSEERDKTLKATVEKLEKKGHDDRSKILNFEKEVNSLKQRIKTLKQENSSLSDNVKSIESQMKEELSSKVIENERLSHETKQVREELQCKIDQLETDHLSYTAESEAVKKTLEDQLSHLQNELEAVSHHFREYKREQETCLSFNQVEVENLKKQNISLNEKLTSSDVKLENLSQNYDDLSKDLQCSRKENESLQIEIEEREKVILELKSRIKQHENEAMDLKEKQINNMSLIDQLNQQSKSELAAQKSVYDEKLTVLEADYELLKTSLRNCEQEKSVCIETYKKQIKTLQLQSDGEIDRMSHERDELSTTLQTAHLDLNEYKIKFNSLENELEEVSMVNADLKQNLSLLSKELETYQSENQNNFDKDEEISELREIILSLRKREEEMARIISKNKTEKTCLDESLTVLRQENEVLKAGKNTMQQEWDMNQNELLVKIETVTKQQNDLQVRNDKLKAECRKRAMQSHAKCGELEIMKTDLQSMRKELDVVVELNKKLEQVNDTLQEENKALSKDVAQHQNDIGILKTSYEDLLAKELSKQKSEFILKENQLLKRISNGGSFDVLATPGGGSPLQPQNGMTSY